MSTVRELGYLSLVLGLKYIICSQEKRYIVNYYFTKKLVNLKKKKKDYRTVKEKV